MLRTPLASERIQKIDQRTGLKIIQISSFPSPAYSFMYDRPSITPDNQRIHFYAQRWCGRSAPWDIFRCDTDGLNLFQLTERDMDEAPEWHYGVPSAVMSVDGVSLYALFPGEDILLHIDTETGRTEEIVSLKKYIGDGFAFAGVRMNHDETKLYADIRSYEHGDAHLLSIDPRNGEVTALDTNETVQACFGSEPRLLLTKNFMKLGTRTTADGTRVYTSLNDKPMETVVADEDFGNQRPLGIGPPNFAHSSLLGKTDRIQGTGHIPDKCIWIAETSDGSMRKLCEGPYFWHSGASWDGEWIISDTNWPDEGLHLIHVETGNFAYMCSPDATQDHSQFGHPHPGLSQDGRIGVFNSDRTGVCQVYVVHITDEFRENLTSGNHISGSKWF
jgi:oligogalacturonide lyase